MPFIRGVDWVIPIFRELGYVAFVGVVQCYTVVRWVKNMRRVSDFFSRRR